MPQHDATNNPAKTNGQNLSVPAYYEGQDCDGIPDHYVSLERAKEAKASGDARPINRGRAIMFKSPRPARVDTHRDSLKTRWAIVGQTAKPFSDKHLRNSRKSIGPGFPSYALV